MDALADPIDSLPRLSHSNIADQVYKLIKERILSKQFSPGDRLPLAEIAAQLGISRTPLKDALNRLSAEGLIEIVPRSGTYVTAPTLEEIEELFDVRCVLESYAFKLASQRMTEVQLGQIREIVDQLGDLVRAENWASVYRRHVELDRRLHELVVTWSGNEQLKRVWEQVNAYVQISRLRYNRASGRLDLAQQEHRAILAALEDRDADRVGRLVGQHIERTKQLLRREIDG